MAARTDAAARSSVFFLFLSFRNHVYCHQELLDIGHSSRSTISVESSQSYDIPNTIARSLVARWIVVSAGRRQRRRRERKQRRRSRSPESMFLTNARSWIHKMEELELLIEGNPYVRDCCVSIISETWLHPLISNAAVQVRAEVLACVFTCTRTGLKIT